MDNQKSDNFKELARGCLLGALCGDAIGAVLEFRRGISKKDADKALTLPGGGVHKVGRGQITDDGELTLCLGLGLVNSKGVLDLNTIAYFYGSWFNSKPFDMGITTSNALSEAAQTKATENHAVSTRRGAKKSIDSQSNGALMRITPLAIWCSGLKKEQLKKAVEEETKLTHPNEVAIDANIAYVYTIQHLLNNPGDYKGAFQKCKEIAREFKQAVVSRWIEDVEKGELPVATLKIGWLKIAFCYALHYLRTNTSYSDAMQDMLLKGGDTDTNCCIVGGMLGALHGYKGLPTKIVEQVMAFDPEEKNEGRPRPKFLVPKQTVGYIIDGLLKVRPTDDVNIEGGEATEELKSRL